MGKRGRRQDREGARSSPLGGGEKIMMESKENESRGATDGSDEKSWADSQTKSLLGKKL